MKNLLFICFSIFIASCSIAQPGQWNTKNKKAIKCVNTAMSTANEYKQDGTLNYEGAIYWCDKAIEKDPLFTDAYLLKSEYCIQAGQALLAIESLKKALERVALYALYQTHS